MTKIFYYRFYSYQELGNCLYRPHQEISPYFSLSSHISSAVRFIFHSLFRKTGLSIILKMFLSIYFVIHIYIYIHMCVCVYFLIQ